MKILTLDTESTTLNKGHPFTTQNKLVLVGVDYQDAFYSFKIEYDEEPYGENLRKIQSLIDDADLIVGFNLKHDLHWLRRYGILFAHKVVWCCQVAEFAIKAQTIPYPSLNEVASHYGLGQKIDVIATEYWDKGIDSIDIPLDIFTEYLEQDVKLTRQVFDKQIEVLQDKPKLRTLIRMCNLDLLVLEEMEYNGILLDVEQCKVEAAKCKAEITAIDSELNALISYDNLNWGSTQQLSCVLYGGEVSYIRKEPVKNILKSGRESWRVRNVEYKHSFPRLVQPIKGTELATGKHWSTSADTLVELKASGKAKRIIDLILSRHELTKMHDTYYEGVPKLITQLGWADNYIHGNLNQCVAVTGRLSSTKPNMQNMPATFDLLFRSRYAD